MSKEDDIVFLPCPSTSLLSWADELEKTTPATKNLLFFPKKANERQQCYVWQKFLTSLYPFNPVPANPAMNLLWRNANKRATGKAPSIALAIISSQAALHFPISIPSLTVTGITLS